MDKILVLLHTDAAGALNKTALEVLGAAKSLGGELVVGMAGKDVQAAANSIAGCGATRFLAVAGDEFGESRYSTDAAAAEALCRASGAALVLAPASVRWARALPGVAYRLSGVIDTHVISVAVDGEGLAVSRWYYRQRIESVLKRAARPWIIVLESGCHAAWTGDAGSAELEPVAVANTASRTEVVGVRSPKADEQTIRPEAALLFVAGAGWTKNQADGKPHVDVAGELIVGFLRNADASLGSSKSLVDLSGEGQAVLPFLTHMNQVGQTGSTPRHPKGLATCCHGEEPHVVGWRFINDRRAVNLDPNCGWARGKADVVYIADAFAVMTRVNELLKARAAGA
ncbi:MAG: electron transfer flavoprotein subunit alpha [Acidobacteria bacterium]|nr:electron transfer flavoprotein subunit alpha [Acidobacteriota bacterium]